MEVEVVVVATVLLTEVEVDTGAADAEDSIVEVVTELAEPVDTPPDDDTL